MSPFDIVIDYVCRNCYVNRALLFGPSRERRFVRARWLAAWLMRKHYKFTLEQIGHALNREHTTITHAIEAFGELLAGGTEDGQHFTRLVNNFTATQTGGVVMKGGIACA